MSDTPPATPEHPAAPVEPVTPVAKTPAPRRKRDTFWRIAKWTVAGGFVTGLVGLVVVAIVIFSWTRNLPNLQAIKDYRPAEMTRVHAGDGKLIAEYATEHRVFVPISAIPLELQHAFVATEDQRFYDHNGWDPIGLTRAAIMAIPTKLQGKRVGGTSTLTQQIAKNFIVGDDYSIKRKVREIAIARRIEKALTKDQILELYLNDIYFGRRSYGIAAASLNYFGKPMSELTVGQLAYMALLPKGPNNYRLDRPETLQRAISRRKYVLGRMVEDGYITQATADIAANEPLVATERLEGEEYLAAEYFVEEARRMVFDMYGQDEEMVYTGGLSVRTTLDTKMQQAARRAMRSGLEEFDKRHGYRGPIGSIDVSGDWGEALQTVDLPRDIESWKAAVVLDVNDTRAKLGLLTVVREERDDDEPPVETLKKSDGTLAFADMRWARKDLPSSPSVGPSLSGVDDALKTGDVILVSAKSKAGEYALQQVPVVNGGLIAMDAHTGRVMALVGGYSFSQSQFNRATQAYRQPGSAFKPFVYAAALESGYTPTTTVLDAPFVISTVRADCSGGSGSSGSACLYKPKNYSQQFYGMSTLRLGLEKSRNAMTVRLANDMGMQPIMDYGKSFGIYDEVRPELAWSLGAGETTVMRLAGAYATLVNGGKKVTPTIIDRVQDSRGLTIYKADSRDCIGCNQDEYTAGPPPEIPDLREQVIDPVTAYQMTSMLEGVVLRGTGAGLRRLDRPLGGKTGTTNDEVDAWFMGFTPDLVIGVYVGMDTPEPMNETGAVAALPIWRSFASQALKDVPVVPFRIPEGVVLAPVNGATGQPSFIGAPGAILEAFKPGTEPQIGGTGGFGGSIGQGTGSFITDYNGDDAPLPYGGEDDDLDNLLIDNPTPKTPAPDVPAKKPEPKREDVLEDGLY
ncbi:penicillin-binding protein 1A [Robiginitomaculum antarcticum]|uniref:penicillin-binding protein 1A n=1 Tax=Robiginitomaculum antarcticum TaxID=437507 RepID=UPI000369579C|nr:penicillin-binding protein 1A [Robiginitomaculum antarcticum]